MQFPSPSDVNPLAHVTSEFLFGRQFPYPSEKYSLGQAGVVGIIAGIQLPDPLLINPVSHTIGSNEATQFPFPSLLYPLGHTGEGIGIEVSPTQLPFPSERYPLAHVTNGVDMFESGEGRQFPYPSL